MLELRNELNAQKSAAVREKTALEAEIAELKANWPEPVDYEAIAREQQEAIDAAITQVYWQTVPTIFSRSHVTFSVLAGGC